MPNIKSAKKRVELSEKSRLVNRSYKSELATALKKFNAAVSEGNKDLVKKLYPVTVSLLDESVTRGIIHKNKADRKKAEVSSKYIAVATAKPKKAEPKAEPKQEEQPQVEEKVEEPKKTTRAKKTEKVEEKVEKAAKPAKKAAKAEKPAEEKKATKKKETK